MYEQLLTRYHWLNLSNEQRIKMREVFQIPKSGGVEMMGNKIISDGCNENDLKAVNLVSMREFVGGDCQDDTFEVLYNKTIEKIDSLISEPEEEEEFDAVQTALDAFELATDEEKERIIGSIVMRPTTSEVIEEEVPHVKKGTSTKKGKKGKNIEGKEGSGVGSEAPEGTN